MAHFNQDLETQGSELSSTLSRESQNLGQKIGKMAEDVTHRIESRAQAVRQKTTDYVVSSRKYIGEHPLQSVAIAAASGLAMGGLWMMVKNGKQKAASTSKTNG